MAASSEDRNRVEAPSDWQGWQRWLANVDWSDRRCWLQRVTATARAAPGHEGSFTWAEAPQADPVNLTFHAYEEDQPGDRAHEHLMATWPAFSRWWRNGMNSRLALAEARARLEEHMPELFPVAGPSNQTLADRKRA